MGRQRSDPLFRTYADPSKYSNTLGEENGGVYPELKREKKNAMFYVHCNLHFFIIFFIYIYSQFSYASQYTNMN